MEKRILSILLAVVMVISLLPVSVFATSEGTPITQNSFQDGAYSITEDGKYYLSEDVTGCIMVGDSEVTLDLNGYILTGCNLGSVITNHGKLTVKDSNKSAKHYFKVGDNSLWTLDKEATEGTPYAELTDIPEKDSIIEMSGGAITGGSVGTILPDFDITGFYGGAYGSGIYSDGSSLTIDGAVICGNTFTYSPQYSTMYYCGAGITVKGGQCTLINGAIVCGNSNYYFGYTCYSGGIYAGSALSIGENCSVSFNKAIYYGGINAFSSNVDMTSCNIYGNVADIVGGFNFWNSVAEESVPTINMINCIVEKNVSGYVSGGLDIDHGYLNITGGSISYNTSKSDGGGIVIEGDAVAHLNGVVISNNKATENRAGGIFANANTIIIENTTITKNSSIQGGGIFVYEGSNVILNNSTISENESEVFAGGVFAMSNTFFVANNVDFTENKVNNGNGGGIYADKLAATVLNGCNIIKNEATEGGGICKNGGKLKSSSLGTFALIDTTVIENIATKSGGGVWFEEVDNSPEEDCIIAGTKIRMADGTEKNVEELEEGDIIATFDHEKGEVSSSYVFYIYDSAKEELDDECPLTLTFADDLSIGIVDEHDFLEKDSKKYVSITLENYNNYIGKYFYGEDGEWHELLSGTIETTPCKFYEIYTARHLNCFANGLLNAPTDMDYFLNIYDLDTNLKADTAKLEEDITAYGLADYDTLLSDYGISKYWYDATNTKYLNIAIGKGFLTLGDAFTLYNSVMEGNKVRYGSQAKIILDGTVHILDNLVNGKQSNLYLVSLETAFVYKLTGNSRIGVTLANEDGDGTGLVSTKNTKNISKYFVSDNPDYAAYNTSVYDEESGKYYDVVAIGTEVAENETTGYAYDSIKDALLAAGEGDRIRLLKNHKENVVVDKDTDIVLDLNGFVLASASDNKAVIENNGTLKIVDSYSSAKHYFTSNELDFWMWNKDEEKTDYVITGGAITGGRINTTDGDVYGCGILNKGTLTVDGINIVGNDSGNGGGILGKGGSLEIKDSLIAHNNAFFRGGGFAVVGSGTYTVNNTEISYNGANNGGGGIMIENASVDFEDCTIKKNATYSSENGNGGGGYLNGAAVVFTGGKITDNTAKKANGALDISDTSSLTLNSVEVTDNTAQSNAGGFKLNGNSLAVSGSTKVTGNKVGSNAVNIFLADGKKIAIGESGLATGACISLTLGTEDGTGIATTANSNDYHEFFASDNSLYGSYNSGKDSNKTVRIGVHIHEWVYSAANNVISVVCNGEGTCTYTGTDFGLTLSASDTTYDGNSHTAQIAETSVAGQASLPKIKYIGRENTSYAESETAPTDVGTYTAKITINDGTTDHTASVNYSIDKRQLTITGTTVSDKDYDGNTTATAQIGTIGNDVEGDDVDVEIDSATFANANAGEGKDVTIVYKLSGNDSGNYIKPVNDTVKAKILKINPETPNTPTGLTAVEGQTLKNVSLPAGFTWVENGNTSVGDVGENIFHVNYNPDSTNYNSIENIEVTVSVRIAEKLVLNISGDTTARHTDVKTYTVSFEGNRPAGTYVVWDIAGGNYEYVGGHIGTDSVTIVCEDVGTLRINATLVDCCGKPVKNEDGSNVSNSIKVNVQAKPGNIINAIAAFFKKIGNAFSKLFR